MKNTKQILLALTLLLAAIVGLPAAAGAELSSQPTTTWGVTGLATGTQTDTIKSEVWAIEQIGNRLYVGGRFTHVTNGATTLSKPYLAAFNATTGEYIAEFNAPVNNAVYALQASPDGQQLYVGGSFSRYDGSYTGGLIALDPQTGNLDSWSGRVSSGIVRSLDLDGTYLYAAGNFGGIRSAGGSTSVTKVGRFNWQTGAHDTGWKPSISGGSVWGIAANGLADRVYLAGYIDQVNGDDAAGGFKAVNASNGANSTGVEDLRINTTTTARQYVYDVVVTNGLVFVAGSEHFVQVLNENNLSLRKFHMSQPSRGDYQDLEVVGDRVYAGCHCRLSSYLESADGVLWWGTPPWFQSNAPVTASGPNSWVAAFSSTSGDRVQSFVPNMNSAGPGIWAIHGSPDGCVWFGGNITAGNGATQRGISRLCDGNGNGGTDSSRPTTPGRAQVMQVGATSVDITWNASTDNVGVSGYLIINRQSGLTMLDAATTSGTVTDLAPGTYEVFVKAYDAAGNLSYRSGYTTITVTGDAATDTQRPSTPSGLSLSPAAGGATATWNMSSDNVAVAGYRIYDRADNSVVADVSTNSATLSLSDGTHEFYVKAYDAAGNLSWRSGYRSVDVGDAADTQRPTPPTGFAINDVGGNTVASWNESNDEIGVAGYRIYDQSDNSVVADVTPTSVNLSLPAGSYNLYVKAYDAAGNTSWRSNIRSHTFQ